MGCSKREGGGRHMLGTGKRGRVGRNCRAGKKEWGRGGSRKGGREGGFFNCSIHPKLAGLAGSPVQRWFRWFDANSKAARVILLE